jgi:hypothetical protein
MNVRIFEYDSAGDEAELGTGYLDVILPENDEERRLAEEELRSSGRVWIGGGAAPLMLLVRI